MGRPRSFDPDQALDAALMVFWRKGYEGASYADLVAATGVERPALYKAFGNKEALFQRALERYDERYWTYVPQALAMPTARGVAEHWLRGGVDLATRHADCLGCLGVNGALATSDDGEQVRRSLIAMRADGEAQLRERFRRAQAEGDLAGNADPAVLAAYLMAVAHGIAVQAKAGFPREKLLAVADQALASWPTAT